MMDEQDGLTPVQRAYKQGYGEAREHWGSIGLMVGVFIGTALTLVSTPRLLEAVVRCLAR